MPESPPLPLRCACGALRGAFLAAPSRAARGVCYCDDCQAYGRWLGRDDVLDPHGGTEVVQTWPARIRLDDGAPTLALLRLSPKGLHRWYAACCRTPVANTFGNPRMPFTGLMRRVLDVDAAQLDAIYGPAHGVQGRFAPGGCPPGVHPSASLGVITGAMGLLARGWWSSAHTPTPFFGADGTTVVPALVLDPDARRALA